MEPNVEELKQWLKENNDIELSECELELAELTITYNNGITKGQVPCNRSIALKVVFEYYKAKYPNLSWILYPGG